MLRYLYSVGLFIVAGLVGTQMAFPHVSFVSIANADEMSSSSSSEYSSSSSEESSESSDSSDCADGGCKIETQRENTDGTCPAGYDNKYTFYLNGGSPMKMCAKCIGVDKCKAGETCTFEKFTEIKFGNEIKHARCVCKKTTSSEASSSSSEESSETSSMTSTTSSATYSSVSSISSSMAYSSESSSSSTYYGMCGDMICDATYENSMNCPMDCGYPSSSSESSFYSSYSSESSSEENSWSSWSSIY